MPSRALDVPDPVVVGGGRIRVAAPAAVLWEVVTGVRDDQTALEDTVFRVDGSSRPAGGGFGVGLTWDETRQGRSDRFVVTAHAPDDGTGVASYDVVVVRPDGRPGRDGTRVTVTGDGDGRSRLRFQALLFPSGPATRLAGHLGRPLSTAAVAAAFRPTMRALGHAAEQRAQPPHR